MEPTVTYSQPHQGVAGEDRHGDPLLTLDDAGLRASDMVATLAWHLRRATLVGNPVPIVRTMGNRMQKPQPGDLVVVSDSIWHRDPDTRKRGVGYLVLHRAEWWTSDAQYQREVADGAVYPDEPRMVEPNAWYVQYGPAPADVCRWVNCDVIALPQHGDRWDRLG
jgi:hypothetical protein